jgi:hypothetical protein
MVEGLTRETTNVELKKLELKIILAKKVEISFALQ